MDKLVVTIMAAGEGKRMNSNIPKVLHLFKNAPMLVRIIDEVYRLRPRKIIIVTGKYDKLIKETLEDNLNSYIYKKLVFVKQEIPNGTAGAIKETLRKYNNDENVLILNGDMPLIKSSLLNKIISGKINSLVVTDLENPTGYGRILYNKELNNKFIGIREEKDCNEEERLIKTVNVGIYYFNAGILKEYIPMIDNDNIQNEYYLTDIVKVIYNNSNKDDKVNDTLDDTLDDTINNNISNNESIKNIELHTYLLNNDEKYQVLGVNTKEELEELEKKY